MKGIAGIVGAVKDAVSSLFGKNNEAVECIYGPPESFHRKDDRADAGREKKRPEAEANPESADAKPENEKPEVDKACEMDSEEYLRRLREEEIEEYKQRQKRQKIRAFFGIHTNIYGPPPPRDFLNSHVFEV